LRPRKQIDKNGSPQQKFNESEPSLSPGKKLNNAKKSQLETADVVKQSISSTEHNTPIAQDHHSLNEYQDTYSQNIIHKLKVFSTTFNNFFSFE